MENSNCIIITQKEWLNWLAFGYLRVSPFRISYFDNTESSFDKLMSHSVDNALDEEDAYLIASLVNDYSCKELYVKRTLFSDYISIQAVKGFYSLSIKGRDLLEYEMEQSHSILHCDSKIENLWSEWKNAQFRLRNHDKGNKFLEVLGYQKFEVEKEIDDDTLFNKLLKNYNRRKLPQDLQQHNKKNAFSWLLTNYEFSRIIDAKIYSQYKKLRKNSESIELKNLSGAYNQQISKYLATDDDCLIEQHSLIAEKIFFEGIYGQREYFLAITFLVHYYNLLDNDYEINLQFLKTDLTFLGEIYPKNNIPQLIAYFIGKRLNEVYLSYLYIAKNIDEKNINEKKPSIFDTNFFSNLKNEKLTLCNIDQAQLQAQLQDTINKVNFIAEEIKLAYNIEVNNVQASTLVSYAIEDTISDSNSPIQNPPPVIDSSISETNNNPTENLDNPSNTTNDDSTQSYSETQSSVDSQEPEANNTDSQTKAVNELNNNVDPSSNKQLDPYDKEDPIDNSDKPKAITESEINNKSDSNSKLEESEQLDSDHYMDLALNIHRELSDEEKNKGENFINKFIGSVDNVAIKEQLKQKQKKSQKDFFRLFGDLIGDKDSYEDINYSKFKAKLKGGTLLE